MLGAEIIGAWKQKVSGHVRANRSAAPYQGTSTERDPTRSDAAISSCCQKLGRDVESTTHVHLSIFLLTVQ